MAGGPEAPFQIFPGVSFLVVAHAPREASERDGPGWQDTPACGAIDMLS